MELEDSRIIAFRRQMARVIRSAVACKWEGDICSMMAAFDGIDFRRGEEYSSLDAGIILRNRGEDQDEDIIAGDGILNQSDDTLPIIGLDMKTMIVRRGKTGEWAGCFKVEESQLSCDFFCLGFPCLRDSQWLVFHQWDGEGSQIGFRVSVTGRVLENIVPAQLWRDVIRKDQTRELLSAAAKSYQRLVTAEGLRSEIRGQENEVHRFSNPETGFPYHAPSKLQNLSRKLDGSDGDGIFFARYLAQSFAKDHRCSLDADFTRYNPYTGDLALRSDDGSVIFAEIKLRQCEIVETSSTQEGMRRVKHSTRHYNNRRGAPGVFSHTGGRWSVLITEIGGASSSLRPSGLLPRKVLVLRRSDVAHHWWETDPDENLHVFDDVPSGNILNVDDGLTWNIERIVMSESPALRLPRLERLDQLPLETLRLNSRLDGDGLYDIDDDEEEEKLAGVQNPLKRYNEFAFDHYPDYAFQSTVSGLIFDICFQIGRGLLFDIQTYARGLKMYAFTTHDWSADDIRYTHARPRRTPVQMFEFSSAKHFLLLSFARIRLSAGTCSAWIRPQTENALRADLDEDRKTGRKRLVLFFADNPQSGLRKTTALYAIPSTVFDLSKPTAVNHTRWLHLNLTAGNCLDDFRMSNAVKLIRSIDAKMRQETGQVQTELQLSGKIWATTVPRLEILNLATDS